MFVKDRFGGVGITRQTVIRQRGCSSDFTAQEVFGESWSEWRLIYPPPPYSCAVETIAMQQLIIISCFQILNLFKVTSTCAVKKCRLGMKLEYTQSIQCSSSFTSTYFFFFLLLYTPMGLTILVFCPPFTSNFLKIYIFYIVFNIFSILA